MSAPKAQFLDVRSDHATNVALGEMTLREGHKWFVLYAILFFVAGLALLSMRSSTGRLLGVGAFVVAVAIIVYRFRYWRYVRSNENRLAALGKQRLAGPQFDTGVGGGFGLGLGAQLGGAAGRGLLDAFGRL
jgi:hypothetical protein